MLPDAITLRGEMASLFTVALVLLLAVRPVAALCGLDRSLVGDLFWGAGVAFVLVGHVAYLAVIAPGSLIDPFVLIRVQSGIEPLAGAAASSAVWWWFALRRAAVRAWLAVALASGLVLATVAYDGACVLRDACFGAPAPPPLGFPMAGLADARIATPLVEAAVLLALLAAVVRVWRRLDAFTLAASIIGVLAVVRVAFTPLSVAGRDAVDARTAITLAAGLAALAVAAWRARTSHARARDPAAR